MIAGEFFCHQCRTHKRVDLLGLIKSGHQGRPVNWCKACLERKKHFEGLRNGTAQARNESHQRRR